MANGDPLKAGMGVDADRPTVVDSRPYPSRSAAFLARNYVFAVGAPVIPGLWPTEFVGVQGEGTTGVLGMSYNSPGPGVAGVGRAASATGVFGTGGVVGVWGNGVPSVLPGTTNFSPGSDVGVRGDAVSSAGVFGVSWYGAGVLGRNQEGGAPGVRGEATSSAGVEGLSAESPGVFGESATGAGVDGRSQKNAGVSGHSSEANGVRGFSSRATGVQGSSEGTNGVDGFGPTIGVQGVSMTGIGVAGRTRDGRAGVLAEGDRIALRAVSRRTAGYFQGDVVVQRDFFVLGAKSALVPAGKGEYRQLHCLEAPEPWFEDQGEAVCTGRAEVPIDPEFAAAVRGAYQVHLTPYAPVLIWVEARMRDRFVVRCEALPGAGSRKRRVEFAWRITARRGDLPKAKRFAKVRLPSLDDLPPLGEAPKRPALHEASRLARVAQPTENALGQRLARPGDLKRPGPERKK